MRPSGSAFPTGASKGDRTRRRILDAAARLLASPPSIDVSLTDVARQAQLRSASLYFYFESRDDLVDQVLLMGIGEAISHLQKSVHAAGEGARERLRAAIAGHLNARLELSDYAAVVLGLGQAAGARRSQEYESQRHNYLMSWQRLVVQAQEAGDLPAAIDATLVRDLILGAANARVSTPDAGEVSDALIGLLGLGEE